MAKLILVGNNKTSPLNRKVKMEAIRMAIIISAVLKLHANVHVYALDSFTMTIGTLTIKI